MVRYVFREDEPIRIKAAGKADPQVIGQALQEIAKDHGQELSPKHVVDAARSSNHPLHPHFEWDDALAAEAFRLDQARNIIRIVRVEDVESKEGTSRAFLSVATKDGVAYRGFDEVKRSVELQTALLQGAKRDLDAFERRYRELMDVCQIVSKAREAVQKRLDKLENRAAA